MKKTIKTGAAWCLDKWYEKIFYVVGTIWTTLFVIAFLLGVLKGLAEM